MNIPKFWAKAKQTAVNADGEDFDLVVWGWSDTDAASAQTNARNRLSAIAQRIVFGQKLGEYEYGERALREEILQTLCADDGRELGVVTRNRYGAKVLNAPSALFIDIDIPQEEPAKPSGGLLGKLFGSRQPPPPPQNPLLTVQAWAALHPDVSLRVYRTAGGLRCLVTNRVFGINQPGALDILRGLNSDPLYVKLCQAQKCFRARLTPKPWRCDIRVPPQSYPYENPADEARQRKWEYDYERVSAGFATCKLTQTFGLGDVHPDIAPIMRLHDELTCAALDRTLA